MGRLLEGEWTHRSILLSEAYTPWLQERYPKGKCGVDQSSDGRVRGRQGRGEGDGEVRRKVWG